MVHLLFVSDHDYVEPLKVALTSALQATVDANGESLVESVTVFYQGTPADTVEREILSCASQSGQLHIMTPEDVRINLDLPRPTHHSRISEVAYACLFPLRFAPQGARRLLYLDCDVLVRRSLKEVYESDLHGMAVGAVRDAWTRSISDSTGGLRDWRKFGYSGDEPYFSSGVLLFDLAAWGATGADESVQNYLAVQGNAIEMGDQEVLNGALGGRIADLNLRWNVVADWPRDGPRLNTMADAHIRHFVGRRKPWLPIGREQPHADEYLSAMDSLGIPWPIVPNKSNVSHNV